LWYFEVIRGKIDEVGTFSKYVTFKGVEIDVMIGHCDRPVRLRLWSKVEQYGLHYKGL